MVKLGNEISVVVSFGPGYKLRPVRFRHAGRLLDVSDVTYRWKTKKGSENVYHFTVTSGGSLYELSFNASTLMWKAEEVEEKS